VADKRRGLLFEEVAVLSSTSTLFKPDSGAASQVTAPIPTPIPRPTEPVTIPDYWPGEKEAPEPGRAPKPNPFAPPPELEPGDEPAPKA